MHPSGASLMQTVMIFGAACGTVSDAARHLQAA